MSPTSTLLTIAAMHMAAMASPGPNVLLVTQTAMAHSRRRALGVAAGVASGALLLATGAALGLGLLIGQAGWLRVVVQLAGGAYLIFIGVQTWRGAQDPPPSPGPSPAGTGLLRDYRRGLLTNLTNPKAAVFFGSILAPALDAGVSDAVRAAAVLLIALNALWWHCLLALVFSRPGVQRSYGRVKPVVDRVVGALLGLLGARLGLGAAQGGRLV
jgi:threonine/homoserine/homoserine lactone efflux protein